jgi:hypothetical protein
MKETMNCVLVFDNVSFRVPFRSWRMHGMYIRRSVDGVFRSDCMALPSYAHYIVFGYVLVRWSPNNRALPLFSLCIRQLFVFLAFGDLILLLLLFLAHCLLIKKQFMTFHITCSQEQKSFGISNQQCLKFV